MTFFRLLYCSRFWCNLLILFFYCYLCFFFVSTILSRIKLFSFIFLILFLLSFSSSVAGHVTEELKQKKNRIRKMKYRLGNVKTSNRKYCLGHECRLSSIRHRTRWFRRIVLTSSVPRRWLYSFTLWPPRRAAIILLLASSMSFWPGSTTRVDDFMSLPQEHTTTQSHHTSLLGRCRWHWVTGTPVSRSKYSLKANISQTVHPIHSMFGPSPGFSGSADRMALFPFR